MQKLYQYKIFNILGSVCGVMLLAIGLMVISPNVTEGASAEEVTTALNIEMQPVVSVGIGKAVNLSFTPSSAGEFQNGSTKLTVSTNQIDGYQILMSTEGDSADITNIDAAGVIKSIVGSNIATSDFAANSWGYSINPTGETASSYNAVPNTVTQIKHVTTGEVTAGRADEYNLNFGAKVNNTLPAGNYNKLITISVVTNPIDVNNLQHLTYMQDMTSEICTKTRGSNGETTITPGNEPSKQLTDTRDGKQYWVSKLADGNCWMVQNLALDIDADKGLSKNDTDITEDWNKDSQYPPETTVLIPFENSTATGSYSASANQHIVSYPAVRIANSSEECKALDNFENITTYCPQVGLVDVSGGEWQDTWKYSNSNSAVNTATHQYDSHYLLGNWYQWNTATAGSGSDLTTAGVNSSESICPKNWKLPSAYNDGSFKEMLGAYGLASTQENNGYDIMLAPTYLFMGGRSTGRGVGSSGIYWTSTTVRKIGAETTEPALNTNYLGFYASSQTVYPNNNDRIDNRSSMKNVRCVAR